MEIGNALRKLRIAKKLSQGDIERRTGLLRCYTSRVENGYTVPSLGTLERYAQALEVPLYQFFTNGQRVGNAALLAVHNADRELESGRAGDSELRAFSKALSKLDDRKRKLLLALAVRLAARSRKRHF